MIPALSLRQPWLWAVTDLGKPIENRKWNTAYRGPFWLHASKGCTETEYLDAVHWMKDRSLVGETKRVPWWKELTRGGLCGSAVIVDVIEPLHRWPGQGESGRADIGDVILGMSKRGVTVTRDDLRWWMPEQYGFVLRSVTTFPVIPYSGSLNFFRIDVAVEIVANNARLAVGSMGSP